MRGKWLIYSAALSVLVLSAAFATNFVGFIESVMDTMVGEFSIAQILSVLAFVPLAAFKYLKQDASGQKIVLMISMLYLLVMGIIITITVSGTVLGNATAVIAFIGSLLPIALLELVEYFR